MEQHDVGGAVRDDGTRTDFLPFAVAVAGRESMGSASLGQHSSPHPRGRIMHNFLHGRKSLGGVSSVRCAEEGGLQRARNRHPSKPEEDWKESQMRGVR